MGNGAAAGRPSNPAKGTAAVSQVGQGSTFEQHEAHQGGVPAGSFRCDWTGQGEMLQTVAGHGHAGYAPIFARLCDAKAVPRLFPRITFFFDFWDMQAFDTGFGVVEKEVMARLLSRIGAVHILSRSNAVAMWAKATSLASPGVIKMYSKRAEFDHLLRQYGLPLTNKGG
jgi:hypothetical protein